jgi:hypothetical protein
MAGRWSVIGVGWRERMDTGEVKGVKERGRGGVE